MCDFVSLFSLFDLNKVSVANLGINMGKKEIGTSALSGT